MKRLYPISSQTPTIVYAKIALASVAMSSADGFPPDFLRSFRAVSTRILQSISLDYCVVVAETRHPKKTFQSPRCAFELCSFWNPEL
jgi:hypothetical protein